MIESLTRSGPVDTSPGNGFTVGVHDVAAISVERPIGPSRS
jgi:hypothetical protein